LLEHGVDTIFGYPGGQVLFIYDALYKYQQKIRHILTAHEQGAAHAADGYARTTGRAGVCLATSGPGATNLVTGIATAYMDSTPLIAITGNVSTPLLGKDSFQEVDIAGITMPITKHNFIVKDVRTIAETVRRAFRIAMEGRPGPVLIDITKDATASACEYERRQPQAAARLTGTITQASLEKAAELINEAKRPFVYGGGGIILSGASEEFKNLVELADAPAGLSTMGLGGLPSSHPNFTGMIGMHGSKASNMAITECDLLIAVGARFSERVVSNVERFAPNAKILHIDVDAAEINKNVFTHAYIVGDLKETLARLTPLLREQRRREWRARAADNLAKYPVKYVNDDVFKPQYCIHKVGEAVRSRKDIIITTDVGQHQIWACQLIPFERPRMLATSGGMGTMGFGLGAAIGAAIGNPGKTVINISGDGCFRMNNIELATAVEYNARVIDIIINNHTLGMVRQWQKLFYGGRFSHTTLNRTTDFAKIAEAYKALGITAATQHEFDRALGKALAVKGPVVINCEVGPDDNVFPMVSPGAGIDEVRFN
jgi:acetolactate synthase-1/2/3 large subunit